MNMHHKVVKSNLADLGLGSGKNKAGSGRYDQPLCPKPIRLSPAIPEFLKPIRCSKHRCDSFCFNTSISIWLLA